jgi:DNA-binding response OmpR family regulator
MATDTKSRKVVVVDGDGEMLEAVSAALRRRGYEPIARRRGAGLVKLVKDEKPATVVLELALPDYDGQALLKELKDDWDAKKVPVIVVSGYTSRLNYRGREQAEAVLTKPVAMDELLHQVELAAAKKQD